MIGYGMPPRNLLSPYSWGMTLGARCNRNAGPLTLPTHILFCRSYYAAAIIMAQRLMPRWVVSPTEGTEDMPQIFIAGFDGSDQSLRAVDFAATQAEAQGADLHIVHVLEWSPYSFLTPTELAERHKRRGEELQRAEDVVKPVCERVGKHSITVTHEIKYGHPGELICAIADEKKAAQLFIGRTGASSLANRILGSVAMSLVQASPIPITVVP